MSQQSFFIKVKPEKKDELIRYLANNRSLISLKIQEQHYKTKIQNQANSTSLSILPFGEDKNFKQEEVVCTFDTKEDKYIFKSVLNSTGKQINLGVPLEIFQIQRRNNFRVDIPKEVKYICQIRSINKTPISIDVKLEDLSLGGCKITLSEDIYKMSSNNKIQLFIQMHQFESDQINSISRHVALDEEKKMQTIGLQFISPDSDMLAELHGLLVYLDRVKRGKNLD